MAPGVGEIRDTLLRCSEERGEKLVIALAAEPA